jgi:hypothetical protein
LWAFTFLTLLVFVALPSAVFTQEKTPTAEQVAEGVILFYGSRPELAHIRRNGVERGRITRATEDGRAEEIAYERRFVRGETVDKDKVRLDQKLPTMEYSLIYNNGQTFGIINGATFTPRQDAMQNFLSQQWHDLDTLLRYKENNSTLNLVGKDKQQGVDLYVLDVTDKDKRRTRFYISAKKLRVLWLEYEEPSTDGGAAIKYMKRFYDYRPAQRTLVPFRTVLYENGKQTQESRILTVTYGLKMPDDLFQNPTSG